MNKDEQSLQDIDHILAALQGMVDMSHGSDKPLDEIDKSFTQKLQEATHNKQPKYNIKTSRSARIYKLFPEKSKSAIACRIKETCNLTNRQMRLLLQTKYLNFDENGQPFVAKQKEILIQKDKAIFFLLLTGILSALGIFNIIFLSFNILTLWLYSLGLGIAIGGTIGLILDRSFRTSPLVHKLEALKPWLVEV